MRAAPPGPDEMAKAIMRWADQRDAKAMAEEVQVLAERLRQGSRLPGALVIVPVDGHAQNLESAVQLSDVGRHTMYKYGRIVAVGREKVTVCVHAYERDQSSLLQLSPQMVQLFPQAYHNELDSTESCKELVYEAMESLYTSVAALLRGSIFHVMAEHNFDTSLLARASAYRQAQVRLTKLDKQGRGAEGGGEGGDREKPQQQQEIDMAMVNLLPLSDCLATQQSLDKLQTVVKGLTARRYHYFQILSSFSLCWHMLDHILVKRILAL